MPIVTVEEVHKWDNLTQFAKGFDDTGKTLNLAHICKEYNLGKPEDLTDDQINNLYELTDADYEVIATIIEKYWRGTYLFDFIESRFGDFFRAIELDIPECEEEECEDEDREPRYNEGYD